MRVPSILLVALLVRTVGAQAPATSQSAASAAVSRAAESAPRDDGITSGFEVRRRSAAGRFLTRADIRQRRAVTTSDLFGSIPGVSLQRAANRMDRELVMRGPFGACVPAVYLDGRYYDGMTAESLDTWSKPDEIAGIEVYAESSVPTQFRRLAASARQDDVPCGSVVIWTR